MIELYNQGLLELGLLVLENSTTSKIWRVNMNANGREICYLQIKISVTNGAQNTVV